MTKQMGKDESRIITNLLKEHGIIKDHGDAFMFSDSFRGLLVSYTRQTHSVVDGIMHAVEAYCDTKDAVILDTIANTVYTMIRHHSNTPKKIKQQMSSHPAITKNIAWHNHNIAELSQREKLK